MKTIISILLFTISISVFSQKNTDETIYGHITNSKTGENLPYFSVAIQGTTIGTTTDATGRYKLKNLPQGKFVLVASSVGYKTVEKDIYLTKGKSQEIDFDVEEDAVQLNGIVVSANRNEENRKEASTIVNLITPKLLENTNSVCLAQGLNFQPGLRVETDCQNCGYQQVRINGLEGPYSQILIDSRPVFSALAGVYGIEQIPANMIERVEVVRGGGSALFGSNAIGGVINIITKEPTSNTASLSNVTNLIYGKKTDTSTNMNASIVSDDNKTGITLFGSMRQRSPFDYDGDGFTEISKIITKNAGFSTYYKTSNYSKLSLEYHNLNEFRRGGNNLDLPPHESDIAEQIEHFINSGGLKYDLYSKDNRQRLNAYASAQHIDRRSYYGAQKDPNAYGQTKNTTFVSGLQYTYSMDNLLFFPADFTIGTEYLRDKIKDEMLGYNRIINQDVNTKSVFLQNEWKTRKLNILFGGRLDKHNLIEEPIISPRLNFRYGMNEHVNLRMSYSSGFRAPQAFDEDLHVTAVGGKALLIKLSPNLKTEKSQSYSSSIDLYNDFGSVKTNFLIEGFYTNLHNVFVLEETGKDEKGNIIMERKNGAGAVVRGVNLEGKVVPSTKLQFQFGTTLQQSEYKEPQKWSGNPHLIPQKKMFRAPNNYGYLNSDYQISNPLTLSLSGTYTGSMLVKHLAGYVPEDTQKTTRNFYNLTLRLAYNFNLNEYTKLQLNGGVENIFNSYQNDFDKGEFRDSGYIYGPSSPRTFFLGLKLSV